MAVLNLTKDNFDEIIGSGVSLVEFWASWCGPCRMIAPLIDRLAEQYEGRVKVCKVNVDEEEALVLRFGVMTIPTVIVFQEGQEVNKRIGVHPLEEFEAMLGGHI